jgi:streptogramin lyase
MKLHLSTIFLSIWILFFNQALHAQDSDSILPDGWNWTYYRSTNTGIQGDWSEALWIDPEGKPYIAAYNPFWEEGGFARFIESENRWENFSNVDYPVIGDPQITGSARIKEISPALDGTLWMLTWNSVIHFDPAIGPSSLVRFDEFNSPMPGGSARDLSIAPDGSVWIAWSTSSHGGGLVRYEPGINEWTVWNLHSSANNWPGWASITKAIIRPLPGGNYEVWVQDHFYGLALFDSDTQLFSELPGSGAPGEVGSLIRDSLDDAGNVWMFREMEGSLGWSLDYLKPDGRWIVPPQPYSAFYGLTAFHAFGDAQALMVAAGAEVWHFDGSNWSSLGDWPALSSNVGGLDMDSEGNIWVSGSGGAACRDAVTGQWQRYRITNTSQIDMWVRDISFGANGEVWMTGNTGPGVGGFGVFDGSRWYNFNIYTYGLGGDWPFNCDNADAIAFRPSNGHVALNPTNNGIHDWDGSGYITWENNSTADGLAEDSFGRLWVMGNYFSLRYHDGTGFTSVPIDGWGANVVPDPDRPGTVWACANLEVVRTDGTYRYSRNNSDLPELNPLHDVLTTVVADRDGVAWLGSTEGLFRLDSFSGTHKWYHSSNSTMPGDQVTPLAIMPDGRVWFTNFNSHGIEPALIWFEGTEFGAITQAQGLPHAQIYDAEMREVDGNYELWLSCASRGIAVLTVPPLAIVPSRFDLPAETGGTIDFTLNGGVINGNRSYWLLGSVSGISPGFPLPGGQVTLPLNWDGFTDIVISLANSQFLVDFIGLLDGSGSAAAQLNTFGPIPPTAVGATLYFAYLLPDPFDFVSNPVGIEIVP